MVNFKKARERMVEVQVMARGVHDERVVEAMRKVPRHLFVDEALRDQAYSDHPLPIAENQTISQPYIVGLMTESLELKGERRSWRLERVRVTRRRSLPNWLTGFSRSSDIPSLATGQMRYSGS